MLEEGGDRHPLKQAHSPLWADGTSPKVHVLESSPAGPQTVTMSGDRAFAEGVNVKRGH